MDRPVVLLAREGSPFAARLAGQLAGADRPVRHLNLDAPLDGAPVSVRGDRVVWQGCDLGAAGALWLEQPVFPWPQPLPPPCELPDLDNFRRWLAYQREARALAVGALAAAAERVPTLNPVAAAHLAVAPTVALDALAACGLPVAPWRIATEGAGGAIEACAIDATGHDRWHLPADLPAGAPRLAYEGLDDEVVEVLVIGGHAAGARRWPQALAWAAARGGDRAQATGRCEPRRHAELALAAAAALGLEMAAVSLAGGDADGHQAAILLADAAPDLGTWDRWLDGAVAAALARRLVAVAADPTGADLPHRGDRP
jgi:hypothetical protein